MTIRDPMRLLERLTDDLIETDYGTEIRSLCTILGITRRLHVRVIEQAATILEGKGYDPIERARTYCLEKGRPLDTPGAFHDWCSSMSACRRHTLRSLAS